MMDWHNSDIDHVSGPPMDDLTVSDASFTVPMTLWPKPVVTWDVFGTQQLVVTMTVKPSRWQRFWTRVFFGSVWTDL